MGERHGSFDSPFNLLHLEALNGYSKTFYELWEMDTSYPENMNGMLPDRRLRNYTLLRIFQAQGQSFLENSKSNSTFKNMFVGMLGDIEDAMYFHPGIWGEVKAELSSNPEFVRVVEEKFRFFEAGNRTDWKTNNNLKYWEPSVDEMQRLSHLVSLFLNKLEDEMLKDTTFFSGYTRDFLRSESVISDGREALWARNLSKNYCELAKLDKPIYLLIGKGHTAGFDCALRQTMGNFANIKTYKDGMQGVQSRNAELFVQERGNEVLERLGTLYRSKGYNVQSDDFKIFARKGPLMTNLFKDVTIQWPELDRSGKKIDRQHVQEIHTQIAQSFKLNLFGGSFPGFTEGRGHRFFPMDQRQYSLDSDFN